MKLDAKYGKKKEKAELSGLAGLMKLMQTLAGESPQKAGSERPKVAIIYASGLIQAGKSAGGSVLGDAVLGSDTLIKNLHEAEKDPTVKAIVLRVDSPGGSALASDLIWREVVRIEKPIVASLSDVAASGGYYISMGADRIVAEPGTLTGSIGVVGGKVALGGLMDRIGLTTDTVSVGKHGTLMSVVRPFNPEDKGVMRRLMEETYQQFVAKAAEGRKMDRARMESLAAGRIYTGRQAKEAGLVDDLGTLNEAVAAAKELGGLAREADAELLIMPRPQGVLESLLSPLEDRSATAPGLASQLLLLPEPARSTLARLGRMTRMLTSEPVLVVMPFELFIR